MSSSTDLSAAATPPDLLAPVDYLAVEVDRGADLGAVLAPIRALADSGTIGIVDLALVAVADDGTAELVELGAVAERLDVELGDWAGAASGLVDAEDAITVGAAVTPGKFGAVVVYENLWVLGIADDIAKRGGRLVADGGVTVDDLLAALDAAETGEPA